ncbi:hypothetical protein FVF58_16110 [Paraburkholderia panacisoli]|jgi:hypothetical protein|uniref:Uncharacterized protein n=1 Tax=Paraburkholderia panacisoli TaxID=2603818 RepID=A0A5B0H8C1_9BURK|nr:hypothetical protein [Paraburkholderia panacisoli]KAA1011439.1 hypothetical protein FVF58_16110 [Paraburkholderia panacisoli]
MKSQLMAVFAAGGLLVMPGLANAQDTMPAPQAQQQQNPATPAASSDMNSQSYGGVPSTNTQSGRRAAEKCRLDPQCNIFFGS